MPFPLVCAWGGISKSSEWSETLAWREDDSVRWFLWAWSCESKWNRGESDSADGHLEPVDTKRRNQRDKQYVWKTWTNDKES